MPMCTWSIFVILPPLAVWYGDKLLLRWRERNSVLRKLVKANVSGYQRRKSYAVAGCDMRKLNERT